MTGDHPAEVNNNNSDSPRQRENASANVGPCTNATTSSTSDTMMLSSSSSCCILVTACDLLWGAEEESVVTRCLDSIRSHLLFLSSTPITSCRSSSTTTCDSCCCFDPSEIFLAIQAAFFKFRKRKYLARQALLTVETLARVCVGPAWQRQLQQQQQIHNDRHHHHLKRRYASISSRKRINRQQQQQQRRREGTVDNDDDNNNSNNAVSVASSSPPTTTTAITSTEAAQEDSPQQQYPHHHHHSHFDNNYYPPIPELLPAVMIRFLAFFAEHDNDDDHDDDDEHDDGWDEQVLLAQISLVLSLTTRTPITSCPFPSCFIHDYDYSDTESESEEGAFAEDEEEDSINNNKWRIVGVQKEMGRLVLSWLLRVVFRLSKNSGSNENTHVHGSTHLNDTYDDKDDGKTEEEESRLLNLATASSSSPPPAPSVSPPPPPPLALLLGRVVRACSLLLSNGGWRPLGDDLCEHIVSSLVKIMNMLMMQQQQSSSTSSPPPLSKESCSPSASPDSNNNNNEGMLSSRSSYSSLYFSTLGCLYYLAVAGLVPEPTVPSVVETCISVVSRNSSSNNHFKTQKTKQDSGGDDDDGSSTSSRDAADDRLRCINNGKATSYSTAIIWALLQREPSAVPAMETLLDALRGVDVTESSPSSLSTPDTTSLSVDCHHHDHHLPSCLPDFGEGVSTSSTISRIAVVAVRILSSALWGEYDDDDGTKSPTSNRVRTPTASTAATTVTTVVSTRTETAPIPLLRAYFYSTLQLLFQSLEICATATTTTTITRVQEATMQDEMKTTEDRTSWVLRNSNIVIEADLVCEILHALGKAVKSQCLLSSLSSSSDNTNSNISNDHCSVHYLSVIEWDIIVCNLESCVITPWLSVPSSHRALRPLLHLRVAAKQLILDVCDFLDHSTNAETVPFVEYHLQKQLYLTLLRLAIPELMGSDRGDDAKAAAAAGVAVIRNWIKFGLFPYRLESWSETAADILKEAFRKDQDGNSYVHDPTVRLQALQGLTAEEAFHTCDDHATAAASGRFEAYVSIISPSPSLLMLTQHLREQHLDFIRSSIIPFFEEVLSSSFDHETINGTTGSPMIPDSGGLQRGQVQVDVDLHSSSCCPKQIADVFAAFVSISSSSTQNQSSAVALPLYCVGLVGRLYRSVSGDRQLRLRFVDMLRAVALNEHCHFAARVASVVELHRCLEAAFHTLLHAHESVPNLIRSLCDVFDSFTQFFNKQNGAEMTVDFDRMVKITVLGVAALDPLARLRVAIDRHVAFRARESQVEDTADLLHDFFTEATTVYRSAVVETYGAPCLGVRGTNSAPETVSPPLSSCTVVSFEDIIDSILLYLQLRASSRNCITGISALEFAQKCMRVHCFDILRHQFLAAIPVRVSRDIAQSIFASSTALGDDDSSMVQAADNDEEEVVARSLALVRCAENAVILLNRRKDNNGDCSEEEEAMKELDVEFIPFIVNLVLRLVESSVESARVIGCHGITALLSGLYALDKKGSCSSPSRLMEQVFSFLQKMLSDCESSTEGVTVSLTILTIMHDLLGVTSEIPGDLLRKFFVYTAAALSGGPSPDDSFFVHLATRCAATLLDRMDNSDLQLLLLDLERKGDATMGTSVTERVMSQLLHQLMIHRHDHCYELSENVRAHGDSASSVDELERLSTEIAAVESFQSKETAAWLLSEGILLTCRRGAPGTRFHGFVEVVTRTLIGRHRSLVRIPSCASVSDPEYPSPLRSPWHDCVDSRKGSECDPKPFLAVHDNLFQERPLNRVASRAAMVSARFNSLMCTVNHDSGDLQDAAIQLIVDQPPVIPNTTTDRDAERSSSPAHDIPGWLQWTLENKAADAAAVMTEIRAFIQRTASHAFDSFLKDDHGYPQRLKGGAKLERAIAVLDRTPSSSTYKIGFLYDQSAEHIADHVDLESRLLMTESCSPAFYHFARGLGHALPTRYLRHFSGGLDTSSFESDGKCALLWSDAGTSDDGARSVVAARFIVFHVVSMMPEHGPGPKINRKRHLGNNYVHILFADRGSDAIVEFDLKGGELIGGAFGFVGIWVTVAEPGIFRINVRVRKHRMNDALHATLSKFVSDNAIAEDDAPSFVRNIAMRADLACRAAIGAADAPSNYFYRFELISEMERFVCDSHA